MKQTILGTNDPRRNEVLGLVRRQLSAGSFTEEDVEKWKGELEADVVDALIKELAPKKAAKAATSKKAGPKGESAAPEPKE